jgi:hypothetical protein
MDADVIKILTQLDSSGIKTGMQQTVAEVKRGLDEVKAEYKGAQAAVAATTQALIEAKAALATNAGAWAKKKEAVEAATAANLSAKAALAALKVEVVELTPAVDKATYSMLQARLAGRALVQEVGGPLSFVFGQVASQSATLGPLMANLFPYIAGAAFVKIAYDVGKELYDLVEKSGPLIEAEKQLAEQTAKDTQEFSKLEDQFEHLEIEKITQELGKLAGLKLAGFFDAGELARDESRVKYLSDLAVRTKQKIASDEYQTSNPVISTLEAFNPLVTGMKLANNQDAQAQIDNLKKINDELDTLNEKLRVEHLLRDLNSGKQSKQEADDLKDQLDARVAAERKANAELSRSIHDKYDDQVSALKAGADYSKAAETKIRQDELAEAESYGNRVKELTVEVNKQVASLTLEGQTGRARMVREGQRIEAEEDKKAIKEKEATLKEGFEVLARETEREEEERLRTIQAQARDAEAARKESYQVKRRVTESAGAIGVDPLEVQKVQVEEADKERERSIFGESVAQHVQYLQQIATIDQEIITARKTQVEALRSQDEAALAEAHRHGDDTKLIDENIARDDQQLAALSKEAAIDKLKSDAAIVEAETANWQKLIKTLNGEISSGLEHAFNDLLQHPKNFQKDLNSIWQKMLEDAEGFFIKLGVKIAEIEALKILLPNSQASKNAPSIADTIRDALGLKHKGGAGLPAPGSGGILGTGVGAPTGTAAQTPTQATHGLGSPATAGADPATNAVTLAQQQAQAFYGQQISYDQQILQALQDIRTSAQESASCTCSSSGGGSSLANSALTTAGALAGAAVGSKIGQLGTNNSPQYDSGGGSYFPIYDPYGLGSGYNPGYDPNDPGATGNDPGTASGWSAGGADIRPKAHLSMGTNYVPKTGSYLLHQGESVQPKAYNPAVGGQGAGGDTHHHWEGGIHINAPQAANVDQIHRELMTRLESQMRRTNKRAA